MPLLSFHSDVWRWRVFILFLIGAFPAMSIERQAIDFGESSTKSVAYKRFEVTLKPGYSPSGFDIDDRNEFTIKDVACTGIQTNCSVEISFAPKGAGIRKGALKYTSAAGQIELALLSGVGVAAEPIVLSEKSLPGSQIARFGDPGALAIDAAGVVYFVDRTGETINRFNPATGQTSLVAGIGIPGFTGDGGLGTEATLDSPSSIAINATGDVYFVDQGNHVIRRVDAHTGVITTLFGNTEKDLHANPSGLTFDNTDNLYFSDSSDGKVRRIDALGQISIVAGGGSKPGFDGLGDGELATDAIFESPTGLAMDADRNIFIADTGHNMVRVISGKTGIVNVLAGTGRAGYSGDSGPAARATLDAPSVIRLDAAGDLYVVDRNERAVREIEARTGLIRTLIGVGKDPATSGRIPLPILADDPYDLVIDGVGNIYLSDSGVRTLRQVGYEMCTNESSCEFTQRNGLPVLNAGNKSAHLTMPCSGSSILFPGSICETDSVEGDVTRAGSALRLSSKPAIPVRQTGDRVQKEALGHALPPTAVPPQQFQVSTTPNEQSSASQDVALSGSPNRVVFGSTHVTEQLVQISNPSEQPARLYGLWIEGDDSRSFRLLNSCKSQLGPRSACSIRVFFVPSTSGLKQASIQIRGEATATIALRGE